MPLYNMPMHSYTKRRQPHFVSSDSSLAIRRFDRTSPRVCNNPPLSSTYKLTSEKTVTLPKGNTKVLVVDSSGEKHTTLVNTNEVQNIDILKVIKMEEDSLKSIQKEKLSRKGSRNEKSSKERLDDIHKRKLTKTRLYRNRALCHKSRKVASFSKGSIETNPSFSNPRLTHSTSTQTENLDIPISNEDRHLIGLRRSSSRIFYQDSENIHRNQDTSSLPPKPESNPAAGDGNKLNRTSGNISNTIQKVNGREKEIQRDSLRDLLNHHTALNIQPEIMNARNLAKYRTAQRFSTMESTRSKGVEGPCVLIRKFKKFNRNGNLRRALSVILFAAMLSWFFQAVFRFSFPTDIFRVVGNYLFSLPIFVKRRELTKIEIVVKYVGNFFRFLGNIFSN